MAQSGHHLSHPLGGFIEALFQQGIFLYPTLQLGYGLLLCVSPMYHDRIAAKVAAYVNPDDVFQWDVHEPTDAVVAASS